ncbi:uncharacterized protein LOC105429391 isoform X1 [Pogonomyrmex barbatus]|uniref:Uncharacterized protein LOC105429391 isoform X1 n=1 Tax=Pogonomyrmex barbatus TaxID=144034 RepID=A0A8N1S6W1_9HYME|nr:uncharacterized protein LOC105429391 isoform X1 [Pogonomyrmex barbatus]
MRRIWYVIMRIQNPEWLQDSWGSDHYPIIMEMDYEIANYIKKTNRISSNKTKWDEYSGKVTEIWEKTRKALNLDLGDKDMRIKYNLLCESMKMAIEEITPRRRDNKKENKKNKINNKRVNPVKWWDEECEEVIRNRKKAQKKFVRKETMHAYIEYKRCRAIARKVIKLKKTQNFESFCTSINKNINMNYV